MTATSSPTRSTGTPTERHFSPGGHVLIRSPLRAVSTVSAVAPSYHSGTPEYAASLRAIVDAARGDAGFAEAVAVASTSFMRTLELTGPDRNGRRPEDIERTALTAVKYALRMSTRCTPFGLLAGIGMVPVGEGPPLCRGTAHSRRVFIDNEWLDRVARSLVKDPSVAGRTSYVFTDLATPIGRRLYAPPTAPPDETLPGQRPGPRDRMSVRRTAAVEIVREATSTAQTRHELVELLRTRYPSGSDDRLNRLVDELVRAQLLLDDLRPRADDVDPLGRLQGRLRQAGQSDARLATVACRLEAYRDAPLDRGLPGLRRLWDAMDAVHTRWDRPEVQVDVALDYSGTLPRSVADEAAAAASVLYELSSPSSEELAIDEYLDKFRETYSFGTMVPFFDMVDETMGIGLPPGYGTVPVLDGLRLMGRHPGEGLALLAERTQEALARGHELVLDDDLLARLKRSHEKPPPRSLEICFHIESPSESALHDGRFLLWAAVLGPSHERGALAGRFLDRETGPLYLEVEPDDREVVAQLIFEPSAPRCKNVTRTPLLRDHALLVGVFPRVGVRELTLEDVLVSADEGGFQLYWDRGERPCPLRVSNPNVLGLEGFAPILVRLVVGLSLSRERRVKGWNWGALRALPKLPRVRWNRVILAGGTWRLPEELRSGSLSREDWHARFARWRCDGGIEDCVQTRVRDEQLTVDLSSPLHVELLRSEVTGGSRVDELVESPHARAEACGWNAGYAAEVVFPLRGEQWSRAGQNRNPRQNSFRRARRLVYPPGGPWVSLKLYCHRLAADDLLVTQVPDLLRTLDGRVEDWFFVRYGDPDFHLRLRIRGADRHGDGAPVLPTLDWARGLVGHGVISRFVVDTYLPEVGRYGEGASLDHVHRVFTRDSELVLAHLAGDARRPGGSLRSMAVNAVRTIAEFRGAAWPSVAVNTIHKARPAAVPVDRNLVRSLIQGCCDALATVEATDGTTRAEDNGWLDALRAYRAELTEQDPFLGREVWQSLIHMNHNRMIGPDRESEKAVLFLVRQTALRIAFAKNSDWQGGPLPRTRAASPVHS